MCLMCGDTYDVDQLLSPFLLPQHCRPSSSLSSGTSVLLDLSIGGQRQIIDLAVLSYHSSFSLRKSRLVHGYIAVYSAKRKASMETLCAFLCEVQDIIPVQLLAVAETQTELADSEAVREQLGQGEELAHEIDARFSSVICGPGGVVGGLHRIDHFQPFFKEAVEKKNHCRGNIYVWQRCRQCHQWKCFFTSMWLPKHHIAGLRGWHRALPTLSHPKGRWHFGPWWRFQAPRYGGWCLLAHLWHHNFWKQA